MAKRNIQKANQLLFSQNMQTLGLKWSIPMPQSHLQTDILYIKCTNMKLVVTHVCVLSCVRLLVTPWTVTQAPLSMEFSRQEHWSGLPFPTPGDLLDPGMEPVSCISCVGKWIRCHWATREAVTYVVEWGANAQEVYATTIANYCALWANCSALLGMYRKIEANIIN